MATALARPGASETAADMSLADVERTQERARGSGMWITPQRLDMAQPGVGYALGETP